MKKRIIFITLLLILLLSSCNGYNLSFFKKGNINVFVAPSTEKILQDIKVENLSNKEITISAAKGEKEASQIIISTDVKINDVSISVSDLKSSNELIKNEQIDVFYEKYIEVKNKLNNNQNYPLGFYPDALVPFEKAVEFKENYVLPNKTQGLWLSIHVPSNIKAGVYKGKATLTLDKRTFEIPISLNVWDFEVPKEVHTKSSFIIDREWLISGELDNSLEKYSQYYEFLLQNRISPTSLPYFGDDNQKYITVLKKYYDTPGFSAYSVLHKRELVKVSAQDKGTLTNKDYVFDVNYKKLSALIKDIVKESIKDKKNYLSKAYYYFHDVVDEPELTGLTYEGQRVFNGVNAMHFAIVDDLQYELSTEDYSYFVDNIKDTVLNIPNIITASYFDALKDKVKTWCPTVDKFNTKTARDFYESERSNNIKSSVWWYTCGVPLNPFPSYHIDDSLLSSRLMSWMQKDYNIDGNLYWCTNLYINQNNNELTFRPTNPYEQATRFAGGVSGDGYLLYPGLNYNQNGPISSIRLEAIRDGLEEYEYLYLLDNLYSQAKSYYSSKIDTKKAISTLLTKLYSGTITTTDQNLFYKVREDIAAAIVELQNKSKFLAEEINIVGGKANIVYYANKGYSVKVNDALQSGSVSANGIKYLYSLPLQNDKNELVLTIFNEKESTIIHKFISNKVISINSFENDDELSKWSISEGSKILLNVDSKYSKYHNSAKIVLQGKLTGNDSQDEAFKPYFSISKENINSGNLVDIDEVVLSIFNPKSTKAKIYVELETSILDYSIGEFTLENGVNEIKISGLFNKTDALKDAIGLKFKTDNLFTADKKSISSLEIYADELYCTIKS